MFQTTQVLAGNHFTLDLLDQFETEYGATALGVTIMRTRLRYAVTARSSTETGRMWPISALGIREVTRSTLGTYLPTDPVGPGNDLHADWMAYSTTSVPMFSGSSVINFATEDTHLDIKSMRKISELGSTVALYFDHDSTGPVDLNLTASLLLALP